MQENADQDNSEYKHFSTSGTQAEIQFLILWDTMTHT